MFEFVYKCLLFFVVEFLYFFGVGEECGYKVFCFGRIFCLVFFLYFWNDGGVLWYVLLSF